VDALHYVVEKAKAEPGNKPLVINLSQGDNFGSHDGTSLLEQAIDSLLDQPGIAVVKSAGNAAQEGTHVGGLVPQGGETVVPFEITPPPSADKTGGIFDIWYAGVDRFNIAIKTPDGSRTTLVAPESTVTIILPNGNRAYIRSQTNHPENGDNRINLVLQKGLRSRLEPGEWEIILLGHEVKDGKFHIWIDATKNNDFPLFVAPTPDHTITIPGTSSKVITVGAFIVKLRQGQIESGLGEIFPASSIGPTRKGELKPDITAPGAVIKSVGLRAKAGADNYKFMIGTSMSAPHVAGVIALLFEKNPNLTQEQIKEILRTKASQDDQVPPLPNTTWGYGKLDAQAAYEALPTP